MTPAEKEAEQRRLHPKSYCGGCGKWLLGMYEYFKVRGQGYCSEECCPRPTPDPREMNR